MMATMIMTMPMTMMVKMVMMQMIAIMELAMIVVVMMMVTVTAMVTMMMMMIFEEFRLEAAQCARKRDEPTHEQRNAKTTAGKLPEPNTG